MELFDIGCCVFSVQLANQNVFISKELIESTDGNLCTLRDFIESKRLKAKVYQYVTSCFQDKFETYPAASLCRAPQGDRQLCDLFGILCMCRLVIVCIFDGVGC